MYYPLYCVLSTPAAQPQSPVVPKLKSDAEDDYLKGHVKSVIKESQCLSKDCAVDYLANGQRRRISEDYYNELGNYVKIIGYLDSYPIDVMVWGYVDGIPFASSDRRRPRNRMNF